MRPYLSQHTDTGEVVLREMGCYGTKIIEMVGQHHERYKGGGYHRGLIGDEISPFARICKITDVYDALTTRRIRKL